MQGSILPTFYPEGKGGFKWLGNCKGRALLTIPTCHLVTQRKSRSDIFTFHFVGHHLLWSISWKAVLATVKMCRGASDLSSLCKQPRLLSDTLEAICKGLCSHKRDPNMPEGSSKKISENWWEILLGVSALSLSGNICLNIYLQRNWKEKRFGILAEKGVLTRKDRTRLEEQQDLRLPLPWEIC